jgi:hypothetical protein
VLLLVVRFCIKFVWQWPVARLGDDDKEKVNAINFYDYLDFSGCILFKVFTVYLRSGFYAHLLMFFDGADTSRIHAFHPERPFTARQTHDPIVKGAISPQARSFRAFEKQSHAARPQWRRRNAILR